MIELPYPPSVLNPNKRTHWAPRNRAFQKYKTDCFFIAKQHPKQRVLKITFHPPDKRRRDRDNIIASFKAGQDGLAEAWRIDDSEFEITYAPIAEPVKHGKVVIE